MNQKPFQPNTTCATSWHNTGRTLLANCANHVTRAIRSILMYRRIESARRKTPDGNADYYEEARAWKLERMGSVIFHWVMGYQVITTFLLFSPHSVSDCRRFRDWFWAEVHHSAPVTLSRKVNCRLSGSPLHLNVAFRRNHSNQLSINADRRVTKLITFLYAILLNLYCENCYFSFAAGTCFISFD